jgi:hypothetical protein
MPDCSGINHQRGMVGARLANLRQQASAREEERRHREATVSKAPPVAKDIAPLQTESGLPFVTRMPEPPKQEAPCVNIVRVEGPNESTVWTGWQHLADGSRSSCDPTPAEIASIPPPQRKPFTPAELKAMHARNRAANAETMQLMEDDMAYRRAHGQAPGNTPIPAGHYEVTGAH